MADCDKCNTCPFEQRITSTEKDIERNSGQHEKIYMRLTELETQSGVTNKQFEQIMDTLRELKAEIKEIKDKPSKRWDTVITVAITAIVSATISFLISSIK